MMKKIVILSVLVFLAYGPVFAQDLKITDLDVTIGKVRVPRAFIHAGKEFDKGNYWMTLTSKEGVPYFNVFNQKKELLFEELAVLIPLNTGTGETKAWSKVTQKMLIGHEYFRIRVLRPDSMMLAYLLIKPGPATPVPATPQLEPKKTEEVEMH